MVEPPPGVRFVDLRQVVRYRGDTEAEARTRAAEDGPVAARAGFVPMDTGRWEERPGRSALIVVYRFAPPARLERAIDTEAGSAAEAGAADAVAMAAAGYIPVHQTWKGRTHGGLVESLLFGVQATYGWMGAGSLAIEYRYHPQLAGEPVIAIALTDERRRTGWWVLDEVSDPRWIVAGNPTPSRDRRRPARRLGAWSGPRLVDRCHVVRYRVADEAQARALAVADTDPAARAGFEAEGEGRWHGAAARPALVVAYRWSPPPAITRSMLTVSAMARGVAAVDAETMATAGYVPVRHDWHGTSTGGKGGVNGPLGAFGSTGQGWLIVEYRYAPGRIAVPRLAAALADERGRTGWWVLDELPDPR